MPTQLNLFDMFGNPAFGESEHIGTEDTLPSKIRLIELFAGVGTQAMALRDIGADFEHHLAVDFDQDAINSYNAIHGTDFPSMDITKLHASDLNITETDKYHYVLTYSFPCTDLSVAGKQMGMDEDSGTRSSLLWEVRRLFTESINEHRSLPQTLVMENVTQVHGSKNQVSWKKWIDFLQSIGYKNSYMDMNAKDYGIAQSRNRTIMISRLNSKSEFVFPEKIPLVSRMKDYLESNVEDRYYLYSDKAKTLISNLVKEKKLNLEKESECVDKSVNYP